MPRITKKYTNIEALSEYVDNIKDLLDTKIHKEHNHDVFNGKKIIVSSTVPTVNDTNVITLLVDSSHITNASDLSRLTLEASAYLTNIFTIFADAHYTVQAYFDNQPVTARYQVENITGQISIPASTSTEFDAMPQLSANQVRVFYNNYEKAFNLSQIISGYSTDESRLPQPDSGFYANGIKVEDSVDYTSANSGLSMVWVFNDEFDISELVSIEVFTFEQPPNVNASSSVVIEDMLSYYSLNSVGYATVSSGMAHYDITEEFTSEDIGRSLQYIVTATFTDGIKIRNMYMLQITE